MQRGNIPNIRSSWYMICINFSEPGMCWEGRVSVVSSVRSDVAVSQSSYKPHCANVDRTSTLAWCANLKIGKCKLVCVCLEIKLEFRSCVGLLFSHRNFTRVFRFKKRVWITKAQTLHTLVSMRVPILVCPARVLILYFVRPLVILRTNFITTFKLILYKNRTIQQSRVATSHTERVEYKI